MAVGRTLAVALSGLDGSLVDVEADITSQLPGFVLIGLPDAALSQARERVRAATGNAGCEFPVRRVTVNLSPAVLPKHGSGFDLAIALAVLAAGGSVSAESVAGTVHLGELGLDGRLRPTHGVLPAVLAARRAGCRRVMVPRCHADEASLVPDMHVVAVSGLREAAIHHGAELEPEPDDGDVTGAAPPSAAVLPVSVDPAPCLGDVVGNEEAVEALVVAAAGGHHMFLLGPPGAGKTMLAQRLPGLLPDLDEEAALEVGCVRSLCGDQLGPELPVRPPLEAPHHTASAAGLVGGGSGRIRPGAAVRASGGVLFLDEAPEFSGAVLDCLRQPLESGVVSIHRANGVAHFPGRFQLVMAANPCPCGSFGVPGADCTCPPQARRRYLARLSGPLMDRMDIRLTVRRVTSAVHRAADGTPRTTTASGRARVSVARAAAAERWSATPWRVNAHASGTWLRREARLGRGTTASLDRALDRGLITMRGYDRVLRIGWTLADLDGAPRPDADHLGRALLLRGAS
ncbi:YifB family Mg chelatase-like AAA ATPase [Clavibacter tessellarius]|uniref:Mg chelatase-like protein n=1 Tax=Clavibacter tessellarius TaxID=31965 RepID=A0A225CNN2_9MICO|nr:YifB family Mg chelatase-like AAA ATPase [Clavibacter michiganensis]OQJ63993.1 Mg chelatase-like protein [Clavibacter michiganensis subsp. tessellarius]UKF33033.1 YifB family Mg chelatase-like AAA ATPase [Clavibacter michiganensis subsp. tessellarius]